MELIKPFWFSPTDGLVHIAGRRVHALPPGVLPLDLGEFGNQALDTRPITATDLEDWDYDKETIGWVMDALADRRVHDTVRGVWFLEPGYERNTRITVPREGAEIWDLATDTEDGRDTYTFRYIVVYDQRAVLVAVTVETPSSQNQISYYGPAERIVAVEWKSLLPTPWTEQEDGSVIANLSAESIARLGATSDAGGDADGGDSDTNGSNGDSTGA